MAARCTTASNLRLRMTAASGSLRDAIDARIRAALPGDKGAIASALITGKRDALIEVLKRVNVAFMNDAEIRQLTGETNLARAAAKVHDLGPSHVIVKKGEHGAVMYCSGTVCFMAASYPLTDIADPTGAGDSFAGGFMGHIARTGDLSEPNLRRAVIYGSTLASFNVQDFSLNRFKRLTVKEIDERYEEFRRIVHFDPL